MENLDKQVEAVRDKLRSYNSRKAEVERLKGELRDLWDELNGVKSVPLDRPIGSSSFFSDLHKIAILEDKEPLLIELQFKIKVAKGCVLETEAILSKLPNDIRDAAKRIYIDGETYTKVSRDYYISESGLFGRITRAIIKYVINESIHIENV